MDCTPKTGSGSLSMMKNPKAQQVKVRSTIHAAFTEVTHFHTLFLGKRSSAVASIRLSLTDVVANG